jgi:hypothetical protein
MKIGGQRASRAPAAITMPLPKGAWPWNPNDGPALWRRRGSRWAADMMGTASALTTCQNQQRKTTPFAACKKGSGAVEFSTEKPDQAVPPRGSISLLRRPVIAKNQVEPIRLVSFQLSNQRELARARIIMSYYTDHGVGADWEACGIASAGGAAGLGASLYFFEFRSQSANCRAYFVFVGATIGEGGGLSFSGGSPSDLIHNQDSSIWTALDCGYFSASQLDLSVGQIFSGGGSVGYGYSAMGISAGLFPVLFSGQNVSGWGSGVGLSVTGTTGLWKQVGDSDVYS